MCDKCQLFIEQVTFLTLKCKKDITRHLLTLKQDESKLKANLNNRFALGYFLTQTFDGKGEVRWIAQALYNTTKYGKTWI